MILNRPVSLADQIYERLENDIYAGVYKRGDILTEPAVCEMLGVSRTPVHEAFTRLKYDHIVEESSKGAVVLGVSDEDAAIIYNIRKEVESNATAACARNITDEQISELAEIVDLQSYYAEKNNSEKVRECDSDFHQKIYRYSGSAIYFDVLEPLHKKLQKYREVSVSDKGRAYLSVEEHKAILDAIKSRNEKAAFETMHKHICAAEKRMKEKSKERKD
ncbi:MAG: GntR family transcriptional regulator [Firmicutes bacterium]|nr:GntR family transcriptional regulator [Bacillota bacterium]